MRIIIITITRYKICRTTAALYFIENVAAACGVLAKYKNEHLFMSKVLKRIVEK